MGLLAVHAVGCRRWVPAGKMCSDECTKYRGAVRNRRDVVVTAAANRTCVLSPKGTAYPVSLRASQLTKVPYCDLSPVRRRTCTCTAAILLVTPLRLNASGLVLILLQEYRGVIRLACLECVWNDRTASVLVIYFISA